MKITFVSTLERGGPVSHLLTLAPALQRQGADVTVVCATDALARRFRESGLEAHAAAVRHKFDLGAVRRLWPFITGRDIVHSQDRRAGLVARTLARARGVRVVHTLHGLPERIAVEVADPRPRDQPALASAWERHGLLRAEAALARLGPVITPSNAMATYLCDRCGFRRDAVHVVPNAAHVKRTGRTFNDDAPVLGVAAQLEPWKGIDVLLHACARLARPVRLRILGDGSCRGSLEALARTLGIDADFQGHVEDVDRQLETLDLFVLPSRAENGPMSILEAMAHALPVVATRVGGVSEIVEDENTGLLVPTGNAEALAAAIGRLLGDPRQAEAMGERGAARLAARFDPDAMARQTIGVYRESRP
jgi:glycosyltransferase involved in cell wall biosynthesis